MFEGTFLWRQHPLHGNVCASIRWKLNLSSSSSSSSSSWNDSAGRWWWPEFLDQSCNTKDVSMSSIFLPVSLLGLLLSLFSACVFIRQRQRTSFRASLVALSMVTSGYMLFTSVDFVNVLSGACLYWREPRRHPQVLLGAVVCLLSDCLLCLRNWCCVLMTAQRTEALLFPLRVTKLLSRRNFVATLLLLPLLFLPLSLVRSFAEFFVVCADSDRSVGIVGFPLSADELAANPQLAQAEPQFRHLILQPWFYHFEAHVFFTVQTVAPVTLVMTFSVAMSVAMLRNRGGVEATASAASKRNKARASRTVLCLAGIFTVLQMPSYLGQLLHSSDTFSSLFSNKTFQFVAELSLFLDSICNMFVYAYFVPDFRLLFVQWWLRLTCRQQQELPRLPLPSSSNYSRRALDSGAEARALRTWED